MKIQFATVDSSNQVSLFNIHNGEIFQRFTYENFLTYLDQLPEGLQWSSLPIDQSDIVKIFLIYPAKDNDALSEKVGEIIHEINNPLAIMLSSLKIIRKLVSKDTIDRDFVLENMDDVESSINRIKNFLADQRNSIKTGESNFKKQTIQEIIDSVHAHFNLLFKEVGVELNVDASSSVKNMMINSAGTTINQIVFNLINNAYYEVKQLDIKKIGFSFEEQGSEVKISISDNGKGVPLELQEKIFTSNYTTKGDEGSGVGLYLVSKYLELNGGRIEIDKNYSQGARFNIYLPAEIGEASPTVLFVDDDLEILNMLKSILGDKRKVIVSNDVITALDLIKNNNVSFVVSDLKMPKLTGIDFYKMVRDYDSTIPFALFSAYVSPEIETIFSRDDKSYVVNKPFYSDLDQLIRKTLNKG